MKCPNCSFVNTDDIKTCRVCGFDLMPVDLTPVDIPTSKESSNSNRPINAASQYDTKISKRRIIDDSEDEALDSAFKSIFESESESEEDPLDVAAVERILQKKRYVQPHNPEVLTDHIPEETVDEEAAYEASFDKDASLEPLSKNKVVLVIVLAILLLFLLTLKVFLPGLPWKYQSTAEPTETVVIESTEVELTTETLITLGDDASLLPVNDFFNVLPEFINRGNLNILSLFENSQEALDILTSYAVIGNLEKIVESTLLSSEVTEDSAVYKVKILTNRLINGQQTQTTSAWDFRTVRKNDIWILESMAVETGESINQPTTEKATEATTEKQTTPTKEPTTETKTTAEVTTEASVGTLLKGFKSKGSFAGGENASGQDVAFVRYGNHDTYERLAFDLYEWIGGKPNQPVAVMTNYTANISDNGRTISIIVTGAIEAYASQSSLNLTNSSNIESVSYNYFGRGEAVAITIILKQPSQYKVFNLVSPAKLVVDIAPSE